MTRIAGDLFERSSSFFRLWSMIQGKKEGGRSAGSLSKRPATIFFTTFDALKKEKKRGKSNQIVSHPVTGLFHYLKSIIN